MSRLSSARVFNKRVAWLWALVCCALWGSAFPCIKIGYRLFRVDGADTASQILFAGCRFTLAGILVLFAGSLLSRRWLIPKKAAARPIAVLALFQTALQYFLFYIGVAHTAGVNSSIITGSSACVTILIACFVFRCERFTLRKFWGCLLGFGGVLLLNIAGGRWSFALNGEGFLLLSTVASAVSTILLKRYSTAHDPVLLSGWQFFFGGAALALGGGLLGGRLTVSLAGVGVLLYLAFLSATAYTLWGLLLKHNDVSAISVYKCAIPLFGALLSAWWLGEAGNLLQWQTPLALILVVGGVLAIQTKPKRALSH
ncbi:MAG: DMT family transporter [Ruminococcaceae bacterium]|nr:DMT family transporter [Oscillospiraceae bacterium]